MLEWSLENVRVATGQDPIVIVGPDAEDVRLLIGEKADPVEQADRLGTGHAVMQAELILRENVDQVLVINADLPLLRQSTLEQLIERQSNHEGPLTILSVRSEDSRGFGRLVRDSSGQVKAIVEEAQATQEQLKIREYNVGGYCFSNDWLWENLAKLGLSPKGEYYLTDMIGLAIEAGENVAVVELEDPVEAIGINNRLHLAEADDAMRKRIKEELMLVGVTFVDPASSYVDAGVQIGMDTTIYPNTHLEGKTEIGPRCQIGPNSIIRDSVLGGECVIEASVLEGAWLEDEVDVGPFAHLREGSRIGRGTHIGNYSEIKNSTLGPGVKMGHFSYLGDATVGAEVNIGAGTITCNFDGVNKNQTEIGEGAFIGSDSMLVAPLRIGKGAVTGAGSVVTRDVPDNTLAAGIPARAIRKLKPDD